METKQYKPIHLLYVPTMACNMQCRYCYLKEDTVDDGNQYGYLDTLQYTVDKLEAAGVRPFNISLHGGEVTVIPPESFRALVAYISDYYRDIRDWLLQEGFPQPVPHIKTNLYGIDRHIDAIRDYNVTISGSLDLPLSLHSYYRRTKSDADTLPKILENLALLETLPNRKKVSATIFREHMEHLDEIIEDIRYLDENTCLDMNAFNFMIGFAGENDMLTPLSEEEQTRFYHAMQDAFTGTTLEKGLRENWFAEFTPDYCTGCDNCGDKFFLLERNGNIYSCVRGQGHPEFYYGNIYEDSVEKILQTANQRIYEVHSSMELDEMCGDCGYIRYCKTGCPFVKYLYHKNHSYTCKLQKEIYHDQPNRYPESTEKEEDVYHYVRMLHPSQIDRYRPLQEDLVYTNMPSLPEIIAADRKLAYVYSADAFILQADGRDYPLHSQILKGKREILFLTGEIPVKLFVRQEVLEWLSPYPVNNSLYIMLLSGELVEYGDEGRSKQEHIMTHQIYDRTLAAMPCERPGYYCVELTKLLELYKDAVSQECPNNLFVTTQALREYHYSKQKENAFYHIQAINLPFQNIEFYYIDGGKYYEKWNA